MLKNSERMAYRSELKWHFIYMMAGREAEKADDRHGTHVPSVQGVTDNYIYIYI